MIEFYHHVVKHKNMYDNNIAQIDNMVNNVVKFDNIVDNIITTLLFFTILSTILRAVMVEASDLVHKLISNVEQSWA